MNTNIAEWVSVAASRLGITPAIVPTSSVSFRKLERVIGEFTQILSARGIVAGDRTAVMVPPGPTFVGVTFALFRLGAVPVLIDPGMGIRGLSKCLADAAPTALIGCRKALLARRLFWWARKSLRCIVADHELHGYRHFNALKADAASRVGKPMAEPEKDAPAAILFTSGSTGPAKGAVYTHRMFQEQVRLLGSLFGIGVGEMDLCTFPLFSLFAPALGMTSVVADMDPTKPAKADGYRLIQAIQDNGVTNIFGSPALLNVLLDAGCRFGINLPSVRRVISAGAPVPANLINALVATMLPPGTQVFTPYGATEALPVSLIGSDEILGETRAKTEAGAGVCVGRPVDGIEVRIIPIDDGPAARLPDSLPVGEIGEITVRGAVVSRGYWNRPDADALHKIADGDTVWHRMGDVGYCDDRGRLWYCGRKSQRVVTAHGTLFTECCEGVFNTHPAVYRSALVGLHRGTAVRPAVCVELNYLEEKPDRRQLTQELMAVGERYAPARHIRDFLIHPGFPVDIRHNAKINREKLAKWAARRLR